MNTRALRLTLTPAFVLVLAGIANTGCGGPDMTMPNPIVAGHVNPNRIVKGHGFAESRSGLPPDSMADEAIIDSLDAKEVCVTVSLHELAGIDLNGGEVKLTSSTGTVLQPPVAAEPPTDKTYTGLVPHEQQTGTRLVCHYENNQTVCESKAIIQTTMVPGPVKVFGTKGRLCGANQNLVTAKTTDLSLKITMPTASQGGFMGMGHGSKKTEFRWAFGN